VGGFWGTGLHTCSLRGASIYDRDNGVILNSSVPVMIIVIGWLGVPRHDHARAGARSGVSLLGVLRDPHARPIGVLAQLRLNKANLIVVAGMVFWAAVHVFLRMKPPEISASAIGVLRDRGCRAPAALFAVEMAFFAARRAHVRDRRRDAYVAGGPVVRRYVFWNRAVAEVGSNVSGSSCT